MTHEYIQQITIFFLFGCMILLTIIFLKIHPCEGNSVFSWDRMQCWDDQTKIVAYISKEEIYDPIPIPIPKPSLPVDKQELECLAKNIYYESRGEPEVDQMATSQVVLNRVKDPRWPNTICEVVYQPYQFSWTTNPYPINEKEAYHFAERIAAEMIRGNIVFEYIENANHYHTIEVNPAWSKAGKNRKRLFNHVFMEL